MERIRQGGKASALLILLDIDGFLQIFRQPPPPYAWPSLYWCDSEEISAFGEINHYYYIAFFFL